MRSGDPTLVALCLALIGPVQFIAKTIFQCPNGHYLSDFNSAFAHEQRFYRFGCSTFGHKSQTIINESCNVSESRSSSNGDMYVSCSLARYIAGVEILQDGTYTLLCCANAQFLVDGTQCLVTPFINQYRQSAQFSSTPLIIQKWQAIYNDKQRDRRWWLQLCPVVQTDMMFGQDEQEGEKDTWRRSVRSVPPQWARGNRFNQLPHRYTSSNTVSNTSENNRKILIPNTSLQASNIKPLTSISDKNQSSNNSERQLLLRPVNFVTTKPKPIVPETNALDYYDIYDDNFDKTAFLRKESNLLNGLLELIEHLHNGLELTRSGSSTSQQPHNTHIRHSTLRANLMAKWIRERQRARAISGRIRALCARYGDRRRAFPYNSYRI